MQSQLKAFRVVATKPKTISIETVRGYFSGNEELFTLETLYTVFGNGIVDVDNRIVPTFSGQIPKIGLKITLPGKFDRLEWYGRGPQENYPDRKHGSEMGIFQSTVADQFVPYVRPQEMGNHEEVRWVALTDAQGNGLLAVAEGSMSFSSLNHTAKQLDAANHTHELKPLDEVVLCLDKQVLGLGNGSCGPGVIDPYTLTAAPTTFRFSLRPASGKESAREKLPHVESIF